MPRQHATSPSRSFQGGVMAALLLSACAGHVAHPVPSHGDLPVSAGLPAVPPQALGFDSAGLAATVAYLRAEVDSNAFPGAVLAVGRHGRLALLASVGLYGVGEKDAVVPTTLYDLASLTKVVGLTTACMILVDEGKLALDAP